MFHHNNNKKNIFQVRREMIYMQCGMKPPGSKQDLMEDVVSTLLLFFAAAGLFFAYAVKK